MKTTIRENVNGLSIELTPETVEETSQLLRFTNNVKAVKPSVGFYFSSNPICSIWMKKVSEQKQENSINNH